MTDPVKSMLYIRTEHDLEYPDQYTEAWLTDRSRAVRLPEYPTTEQQLADALRLAKAKEVGHAEKD